MELALNYKVFAFGGNGGETIERLIELDFPTERLYYFDTDKLALKHCVIGNKFQIGIDLLKGKGTTGKRALVNEAFNSDIGVFDNLIREDCLYIILGGLGGGTFSGMVNPLLEMLSKNNRRFICCTSLPFSFEENTRHANSFDTIKDINKYTDKVILLDPKIWNPNKMPGNTEDMLYKMTEDIAKVVSILLEESFDENIQLQSKNQRNLLKAIELVRDYVQKKEYLVTLESSRIIVARNLQALLRAFKEGVDITRNISPRRFEELVDYIYKVSGHETELTKETRDKGVDIKVYSLPPIIGVLFFTVVQTKQHQHSTKVGVSEIRELVGTIDIQRADRGHLVTNTDFTIPAITEAKGAKAKIDLIKFYELAQQVKDLEKDNLRVENGGGK